MSSMSGGWLMRIIGRPIAAISIHLDASKDVEHGDTEKIRL